MKFEEQFPSLKKEGYIVVISPSGNKNKHYDWTVIASNCRDNQRIKEAIENALELMEKNRQYTPQLKDKKYRNNMTKIELEREENERCQSIVKKLILKELGLED